MINDFIVAWNYYPEAVKTFEIMGGKLKQNRFQYSVDFIFLNIKIKIVLKKIDKLVRRLVRKQNRKWHRGQQND